MNRQQIPGASNVPPRRYEPATILQPLGDVALSGVTTAYGAQDGTCSRNLGLEGIRL